MFNNKWKDKEFQLEDKKQHTNLYVSYHSKFYRAIKQRHIILCIYAPSGTTELYMW